MTHDNIKRLAESIAPGSVVVHGRMMVETRSDGVQILCGVCRGDALSETSDRELIAATVIVIVHDRQAADPALSPEEHLERGCSP